MSEIVRGERPLPPLPPSRAIISGSYIVVAIAELVAAFALMTPAGETLIAEKAAEMKGKWQAVVPLAPED